MASITNKRILGIDPFTRGIGFAVLEGPDRLVDWGLKQGAHTHKGDSLRQISSLMERFKPDALALEDWDATGSRRGDRVERLLNRIATTEKKRVAVRLVSPKILHTIGPRARTTTKYERAQFLSELFPELKAFLPPIRKLWMPEDRRMAIFDALGFALSISLRSSLASVSAS